MKIQTIRINYLLIKKIKYKQILELLTVSKKQ